nr:MAG TPA: hypothetical protein [Caudoviricetes sp.]
MYLYTSTAMGQCQQLFLIFSNLFFRFEKLFFLYNGRKLFRK